MKIDKELRTAIKEAAIYASAFIMFAAVFFILWLMF